MIITTQEDPTQHAVRRCELELARKRDRLTGSLSRLRQRVAEVSHWRTHVRERPVTALLVALAAGWLAAALLAPPRPRR